MTTWRLVGIVVGSVLCGMVLAVGGMYLALRVPAVQALIRDYIVTQLSQLSYAPPADLATASSTAALTASSTQVVVQIPQTYTTFQYFTDFNNVAHDLLQIQNANTTLGPLLVALNAQLVSGSFDGFYDNVTKARALAQQIATLSAQLGYHLTALQADNSQTKDAITKSLTFALAEPGTTFVQSLHDFSSATLNLLGGDVPTSQQISAYEAQVAQTKVAADTFSAALKPLTDRFLAALQAAVQKSAAH